MAKDIDSQELALWCAECADRKKAEEVLVLDMRGLSSVTDHFVLATGGTEPHVRAIWQEVLEATAREHGVRAAKPEGGRANTWVVVDFYDVVVHVMLRQVRTQYDLEGLWNDAPRVPLPERAIT
tara:strand:+ start:329 stop:700 length:372 start_codon:yes stop_codon:yes gene_type:complete